MANTVEYKLKISVPGASEVKAASDDVKKLGDEAQKAEDAVDDLGDEAKKAAGQIDDLGDEARKAGRGTKSLGDSSEKSGRLMKWATGIAAGFAASLGTQALLGALKSAAIGVVELGQEVADLRNDLADASTRSGIAAETLQGLRLAAEGSGLSFSALTSGLDQFASRMQQAGSGNNETARAFDALGVSVKDSEGNMRDVDAVLQETLSALQGVDDAGTRSALAVDTLGRSGGRLLQALSGSELDSFVALSREFGIDIGPKAAQSAGDWQRASAELDLVLRGLKGEIADAFGGGAELLQTFVEGIVFGFEVVKGAFKGFASGVGDIVTTLTTPFTSLLDAIEKVLESLDALARGDIAKAKASAAGAAGSIGTAITSAPAAGLQVAGLVTGASGIGLAGDAFGGALDGIESGRARVARLRELRAGIATVTERTPGGGGGGGSSAQTPAEKAAQERYVQGLERTLDDVSDGFDDLFDELDPTFASLSDAMDGVVAAFEEAIREFKAVRTRDLTVAVAGIAQQVLSGNAGQALSAAGRQVGGTLGARLGTAGAVVGGLQFIGEQGAEGVEEKLDDMKDALVGALEALPQLIGDVLPTFAVELVAGLIEGLIANAPEILKSLIIELPQAIGEAILDALGVGEEGRQRIRETSGAISGVANILGGSSTGEDFAAVGTLIESRQSRDGRSGRQAARSVDAGRAATTRSEDTVTMGTMRRRGRQAVVASNPFDGLAREYDAQYGPYGRATSTTIGGA